MNKQEKLLDEVELCGSPGGCYLRNQKANIHLSHQIYQLSLQ